MTRSGVCSSTLNSPDPCSDFQGRVYPAAEVNYLLWGLVHRLAFEDGISTNETSFDATIGLAAGYRVAFGALFVADKYKRKCLGDSTHYGRFETASGKLAWTGFGWNWATDEQAAAPSEHAVINATSNSEEWRGAISFKAPDYLIDGIVQ